MRQNRDNYHQNRDRTLQNWDDMGQVATHPVSLDQHPPGCELAFFGAFCYRRPRPLATALSPTELNAAEKRRKMPPAVPFRPLTTSCEITSRFVRWTYESVPGSQTDSEVHPTEVVSHQVLRTFGGSALRLTAPYTQAGCLCHSQAGCLCYFTRAIPKWQYAKAIPRRQHPHATTL
jgi:hypothetical protein